MVDWSSGDKREEGGVIQNWYIFEWWLFLEGGGGDHTSSSGCFSNLYYIYALILCILSFFFLSFSKTNPLIFPHITHQSHVTTCRWPHHHFDLPQTFILVSESIQLKKDKS